MINKYKSNSLDKFVRIIIYYFNYIIMPSLSGLMSIASSKNVRYIIVALAIFIGVAIYVYSYYIAPSLNPAYVPNKEFQEEKASSAEITFFYVDWCPHSKAAKVEWDKVKDKFNKKIINGSVVDFVEINGEENDGQVMTAFETQHKLTGDKQIDGFPTIILVKGDQVVVFDAKPNEESLTEFLHTTL